MAVEDSITNTDDYPDIEDAETHAGRLHALLISLVCIDDTPQVIEERELCGVRSWLTAMARDESRLLQRCLHQGGAA